MRECVLCVRRQSSKRCRTLSSLAGRLCALRVFIGSPPQNRELTANDTTSLKTIHTRLPEGHQGQRKETTLQKAARMKKTLRHQEPTACRSAISSGADSPRGGVGSSACHRTPTPTSTTISIGSPRCPTWTLGFALQDGPGDTGRSGGQDGLRRVMRKLFHCPMPEFLGWEPDTLEKLEAASSTTRPIGGAFSRRATTRSPVSVTGSSVTRPRGSIRSSRCGPISRSTAA